MDHERFVKSPWRSKGTRYRSSAVSSSGRTSSRFPKDLAALLAFQVLLIPVFLLSSLMFHWVQAAGHGDPSLHWVAVALGATGAVLLFLARLPLYRAGQFLKMGPRGLDDSHRKLYRRAYLFLTASVVLLLLLVAITI